MDKDYNFNLKITSNDQALDIVKLKLAKLKGTMKLTNDEIKEQALEYRKQQLEIRKVNLIEDRRLKKIKEANRAEEERLNLIKKQEREALKLHNSKVSDLKQQIAQVRRLDMRYLSIMFTAQMLSRAILGFSRISLDTFRNATDSSNGFNNQLTKMSGVWEYFKFSFANAVLAPVLIPLIDIFQTIVDSVTEYGQEHPKMMELIGGLILLAGVSTALISIFVPLKLAATALSSMGKEAALITSLSKLAGVTPEVSAWAKLSGVIGGTTAAGLVGAFALLAIGIGALEGAWDLIMPLLKEGFNLFSEIFDLFGGNLLVSVLKKIVEALMAVGAVLGIAIVTMVRGLINELRLLVAMTKVAFEKIKIFMGVGDESKLPKMEEDIKSLEANRALIGQEGAMALENYNDKYKMFSLDTGNKTESTINNNLVQNMQFSDANISQGISTANEGAAWFAAQPQ